MDDNQATILRDKILEDIKPLMTDDVAEGPDKFSLLMRVIQTGKANSDIFSRAYESAKLIEDHEERLDALLSLLDEIDSSSAQQNTNVPETAPEQPQEPVVENSQDQ